MRLAELAGGPPLDAAIVGGGINGSAIALDLARRGLNVALFEQDDFGFGTTWRSTRLIHGGLRYLEHGDVRLVFESLRERAWLLKARPYLVRPQRFILPVLPWTRRPAWQLRAGLTLYDVLALYRGVPSHRGLGRDAARAALPPLTEEASGAFAFYDARILSPERLALEMAMEARRLGATVLNHATVHGIDVAGGRVRAVEVEAGAERALIPVHLVINAGGPWVDAVNRLTNDPAPELLGVTRGSHIVVETPEPFPHDAVFSFAKSDGRVFFAVPQGRLLLVGTTDDRYDGPPGEVAPTADDVAYLLEEANRVLPGVGMRREHVRYAFAGLRPLLRVAGGPEAAISRRHEVVDHAGRGGPEGLLSVIGGKLSTFRPLAGEVGKRVGRGRPRKAHSRRGRIIGEWGCARAACLTIRASTCGSMGTRWTMCCEGGARSCARMHRRWRARCCTRRRRRWARRFRTSSCGGRGSRGRAAAGCAVTIARRSWRLRYTAGATRGGTPKSAPSRPT